MKRERRRRKEKMKGRMMRKKRKTKGEREEKTGETNKREKRKTKRVLKCPRSAVTSLSHSDIPYARAEPYARVQDPATPPPFGETGVASLRSERCLQACKLLNYSRPCLCCCCPIWRRGFFLNTVKTPNALT